MRLYRPSSRQTRIGWLPVTCWCEREIVVVPPNDVLNLRTRPCGHPECKSPQEQAA